MFMAVLAVLNALISRVTGSERIVIGSNSANRPRPELEAVAGFFLTQVPFATDLVGDPAFREVLARTKQTALSAYAHQNLPFSKLIEVPVSDSGTAAASEDFRFAAAVAALGMLLRESPFKGRASFDEAIRLAEGATGMDPQGYRREFVELLKQAQSIQSRKTTATNQE